MITWPRIISAALLLGWLSIPRIRSDPVRPEVGKERTDLRTVCENPLVRREWRTLSGYEQRDYINAVRCMIARLPITSKSLLPGVTNYYEDFLGTHILRTDTIHYVHGLGTYDSLHADIGTQGIFFPWHRLFTQIWEREIQSCGYRGGVPYWDWTLDAIPQGFQKSPLFDPISGFGGNGAFVPLNISNPSGHLTPPPGTFPGTFNVSSHTGGGCITTGPFANLTVHMGRLSSVKLTPRCVTRDFIEEVLIYVGSQETVNRILNQTTFGAMAKLAEESVHSAGHSGVGGLSGDMSDRYSSPSDPLFYLHHSNMDRLWWSWQTRDLDTRLLDISGPLIPKDYSNLQGGNATLNNTLDFVSLRPAVYVQDSMDVRNLCYTYDSLY